MAVVLVATPLRLLGVRPSAGGGGGVKMAVVIDVMVEERVYKHCGGTYGRRQGPPRQLHHHKHD